jgi:hypothetical protein
LAKESDASLPIAKTFEVLGGARISVSVPPPLALAIPSPTTAMASTPSAVMLPRPSDNHDLSPSEDHHFYSRPLFWTVAAGVASAIALTLLLTVGRSTSDPTPSLRPMQVGGPP